MFPKISDKFRGELLYSSKLVITLYGSHKTVGILGLFLWWLKRPKKSITYVAN